MAPARALKVRLNSGVLLGMEKFISLTPELAAYVASHHSGAARKSDLDHAMRALRLETENLGDIAQMLISQEQGTFLSILVAATGARRVVEVGTFTGYSALCLARALPADGKLFCFDQSDEWTRIARRAWSNTDLDSKISLQLGDAKATLRDWQPDGKIDFAFIDADKSGYDSYFELLLPHLRPNALMLFDNMLRGGKIESDNSDEGAAVRALNQKLASDARLESVLLPVADGIMICRKK